MARPSRRRRRSRGATESLEARILPAHFVVTSFGDTFADDGVLTLREAVQAANRTEAPDTISFNEKGRVVLQNGQLRVTEELTIIGFGTAVAETEISANFNSRHFLVQDASLTLVDLRLVDGQNLTGRGGSIRSNTACPSDTCQQELFLDINNVVFEDNNARYGGAISTDDIAMRIVDSAFNDNVASAYGGAIASEDGMTAEITNTVFRRNQAFNGDGGAIRGWVDGQNVGLADTELTITDSRFVANTASGSGGAIFDSFDTSITNSHFERNEAGGRGGAIDVGANDLAVSNTTFVDHVAGGTAGAIYSGDLVMTSSSVLRNESNTAAGIVSSRAVINNSTIARNTATAGALASGVSGNNLTIRSSILAENTSSGLPNDVGRSSGTPNLTMETTLLGSNVGSGLNASSGPDADGNIIGTATAPIDPLFSGIGRFGTQTFVAPLSIDSPAVNRGSNPRSLTTDQIGNRRVRDGQIDMGALESFGTSVTYNPQNQTATILGSNEDELILIEESNDETKYVLQVGLQRLAVPKASLDKIRIWGGDGDDLIRAPGVNVPLVINAGGGDDTVIGGTRDDDIFGASGDDVLRGAIGADLIVGGIGHDDIRGGKGADRLFGDGDNIRPDGAGNDTIQGDNGKDSILGGPGSDVMFGNAGNDRIGVRYSDDLIVNLDGDDYAAGGDGNDNLLGGSGRDTLIGGTGRDKLSGGGDGDDLRGGSESDTIRGGNGADEIVGGMDNDLILGGSGADSIDGDDGSDYLFGEGGADLVRGGSGGDVVVAGEVRNGQLPTFNELNAAWRADGNYEQKVNRVLTLLPGADFADDNDVRQDVLDDGVSDTLIGGAANDLFFAGGSGIARDSVTRLGDELIEGI